MHKSTYSHKMQLLQDQWIGQGKNNKSSKSFNIIKNNKILKTKFTNK